MTRKFGTQVYLRPLFRQLSLQPARLYLLNRTRDFLKMIFPDRHKHQPQPRATHVYYAPQMAKLTPEQAKLKLLGYLSVGDEGAKDLLDLLFAGPAAEAAQQPSHKHPANSLPRAG